MKKVERNRLFLQFLKIALFVILAVYFGACAKVMSPTGGPKDITPPILVKSLPANKSLNFNGNRIVMDFNEFVDLKDADKYLLVSPPFSKTPDIRVKGKNVLIKFDDTLKPNTTYNFYLGNAIVDITENNPLRNFNFAFSTGPVIDSLSLSGKVYNSFTQEPAKEVFVFLYTDLADSTPYRQKPMYVSRTNEFGRFRLTSLANKPYRLLALKDMNGDLLYNPKAEEIAFADSLVWPVYTPEPVVVPDTAKEKKEIKEDTGPEPDFKLQLFTELDSIQRLTKTTVAAPNLLTFYFRFPAPDAYVRPLFPCSEQWIVKEFSKNSDTLSCWLLPPLPDSVKVEVSVKGVVLDTVVRLLPKPKEKSKRETLTRAFSLTVPNTQSGYLGPKEDIIVYSSSPLKSFDQKRAKLIIAGGKDLKVKDTIIPELSFTDSIHRKIGLRYKWKQGEEYKVLFPAGMITDLLDMPNDTAVFSFKLRPEEEYGNIILNLNRKEENSPLIIQLLDEKGSLFRQKSITKERKVIFDNLLAAKYRVKVIYDKNGNGRWDSGKLIKKQQPEKVALYPKPFEVRAKWDIEESWDL